MSRCEKKCERQPELCVCDICACVCSFECLHVLSGGPGGVCESERVY